MQIALWIVAAYLAVGVLMAVFLSQTPYAGVGWIWQILLWPLFAFELFIY